MLELARRSPAMRVAGMEFENHSRVSVNLSPRSDSSEFVHTPGILHYSQFPFNVYKVSVPPFVSLRVRAKFHSGRNSKHGGTETL